jgi:hypothetical protein
MPRYRVFFKVKFINGHGEYLPQTAFSDDQVIDWYRRNCDEAYFRDVCTMFYDVEYSIIEDGDIRADGYHFELMFSTLRVRESEEGLEEFYDDLRVDVLAYLVDIDSDGNLPIFDEILVQGIEEDMILFLPAMS